MAHFLVERKKKKVYKTKYSSPSKLSKPALIAIIAVVAVVIIVVAITIFIIMRRRKARAKHQSMAQTYSGQSSTGLYSHTPVYGAGHADGGQQQQLPAGGAADEYYAGGNFAQGGGGGQGQDYGMGGYGMPKPPHRALQYG